MKKVAQTLSVKAIFTILVLSLSLGLLPGCAVVAPLLSVGGFAFAPLQYASTAYTIGEFTYEYAANDKTPDKVLEAKYDAMVSGEAFELPAYLQSEPAGPEAPVVTAQADGAETRSVAMAENADPALSEQARQKRIENLLGRRQVQFERLELRRMAFLQAAQPRQNLTLSRTALAANPDLVQGTGPQVSLD